MSAKQNSLLFQTWVCIRDEDDRSAWDQLVNYTTQISAESSLRHITPRKTSNEKINIDNQTHSADEEKCVLKLWSKTEKIAPDCSSENETADRIRIAFSMKFPDNIQSNTKNLRIPHIFVI